MDRYRNDVPLSSYSIWSPKADPTRTMFNFERKLESQNKENNYRYDTFFAAKHISSPKADIQPMTQKSSSVEHRSFKFETAAEHSRKKSRELQLSAVMNSAANMPTAQKSSYLAVKESEHHPKKNNDNSEYYGRLTGDSSKFMLDTQLNADSFLRPRADTNQKLSYSSVLSGPMLGSPKQQDFIASNPYSLMNRKASQDKPEYFIPKDRLSRDEQQPSTTDGFQRLNLNRARASKEEVSGSQLRLSSADIKPSTPSHLETSKLSLKDPQETMAQRRPDFDRSKTTKSVDARFRGRSYLFPNEEETLPKSPTTEVVRASNPFLPQREKPSHLEGITPQKVEVKPPARSGHETTKNSDQDAAGYKYTSAAISQKLEEYANSLRKLEERIFQDKNEVTKGIKTSNSLINSFFKDKSREQKEKEPVEEKPQLQQQKEEKTSTAQKSQAYQSYMQIISTVQTVQAKVEPSSIDKRIRDLKIITQNQEDASKHEIRSPQSPSHMTAMYTSNHKEGDKKKEDWLATTARKPVTASVESTRETYIRPPTQQASQTPQKFIGDKKPEDSKLSSRASTTHLKDFITQVNPGTNMGSYLDYTAKSSKDNTEKPPTTFSAGYGTLSTKNSNVSPTLFKSSEITKSTYHIPQTTKASAMRDSTHQSFIFTRASNDFSSQNSQEKLRRSSYEIYQPQPKPSPTYYMKNLQKALTSPNSDDYFNRIYSEHFIQTFQGVNISKYVKTLEFKDLAAKKVYLPKSDYYKDKKTVVLDLDETLIHCNQNSSIPSDVKLPIRFPSGDLLEAGINIRPYAREFLEELSKHFEVIIFTASHSCYANVVLDHLDPHKRWIQHRLYRDSCISTPEGLYVKDLRVFANRDLRDLVLVDNAAYSFSCQIENGIPIIPYYDNKADTELKSLINYLKSLAYTSDMRQVNIETFKFPLYLQCSSLEEARTKLFA